MLAARKGHAQSTTSKKCPENDPQASNTRIYGMGMAIYPIEMVDTVKAEEMTWYEFSDRVREDVVFLPVGATEQHGPHLPLGVDVVLPSRLCERIAAETGGLVLPPIPYGGRSQTESGGGPSFPGTIDLRGSNLLNQVKDIIAEVVDDGARRIFVMSGHFENNSFVREAIDQFLIESDEEVQFVFATTFTFIPDSFKEEVFEDFPGGYPGDNKEHAGVFETAMMLHFDPSLVAMDKIGDVEAPRSTAYRVKPAPEDTIPETGLFIDPSTAASAELGERVVTRIVDSAVEVVESELQ